MRDIDWWCLIETCLYVNERYRLMMSYWNMFEHVNEGYMMMSYWNMFVLMRDIDWLIVCMLMRDIDWWCLIETCLYVNERYRLMMSYWNMFVC